MKKTTLALTVMLLITHGTFGQLKEPTETPSNFYTLMGQLFENDPAVNLPNDQKNGKGKEVDRTHRFWNHRLAPHGDVSIAANAYLAHTSKFNSQNKSASCGSIEATWQEEGPYDQADYAGGGNGQINRITFDPQFDGTSNQTIYGGSFYGGLWRSTDYGLNWSVVNTDNQLPQTSVSGIGVDYNNSNNLFISTGNGDHLNLDRLDPGFPAGRGTPIFTSGIYRSMDYGVTWNAINSGFINHFSSGGTTTDLKVDPSDANTVYVASSEGLFQTNNSLAGSPSWNKVTMPSGVDDFFSGLEVHPTTASTVYASSNEIVKSTNSGSTWSKLTGSGTTLDFSTLPANFDIKRIKLAVTTAAPDDVYAIFIGKELANSSRNVLYIYRYSGGTWTELYYSHHNLSGTAAPIASNLISSGWMGFAVSPIDADRIYFGSVKFYQFIYGGAFHSLHSGRPHDDIHEIVFEPTITGKMYPDFFIAHHGGITKSYTHSHPAVPAGVKFLENRSNGINTSMLWGLDVSKVDNQKMLIARQDNGTHEKDGSTWSSSLADGDGYGAMYADEGSVTAERYILSSAISSYSLNFGDFNGKTPVDASHVAGSATPLIRNYNYTPPNSIGNNSVLTNGSWPTIGFKNKNHPNTGKTIFGFSELFSEIAPAGVHPRNYAKVQSDIYADASNFGWKGWRRITDFAIAKSNDDYAYIVTHGRDNVGKESDFLRTTTGLSEDVYIDTYAGAPTPPAAKFNLENTNLPLVNYNGANYRPFITGVTVSTSNHLDVWISISGFFDNQKIYKSSDGGINWANADPNNCLPNLPTNTVIYQDGTDDRLYLAMDDGVYTTDNNANGSWYKFGDLPNVTVHQLILNECSNRIYAGTYGRGVWSVEMLPRTKAYGELVINSDRTINDGMTVSGNIRVKSGNKLTVTSTLHMASGANIIVEPNAILEVDGGTLTNSCGDSWGGIQLIGDNSHDQMPLNQPTHQAKLELKNGALIEYAEEAISVLDPNMWSTFGGLVHAEDATIRNMRRAVTFMSYPFNNHSYFKRCTFENTDDPFHSSTPLSMVTLWDNHGASFMGCTFVDNTGIDQYHETVGNGIYSIDASYSVLSDCNMAFPISPCPPENTVRSSFINFNQGIYATGSAGANTIIIDQADFIDNAIGCRIEAFDNVRFTRNTTLTGKVLKHDYDSYFSYLYGYYSIQATGFEIEQNTFNGRKSPVHEVVGVTIIQSGKDANEVYNNTFNNNAIGQVYDARNKNPKNKFEGLQFLCNSNPVSNEKDVQVNERRGGGSAASKDGIRDYQGSSNPDLSASNIFSTSTQSHIENNSAQPITYYHTGGVEEPDVYTSGLVIPLTITNTNNCENKYWQTIRGNKDNSEKDVSRINKVVSEYHLKNTLYKNLLYVYSQQIDNGDTDELLESINLNFTGEALELRNKLMAEAPYLSEEALREAAKTGVLTDAFLLELALANPDATKNESFLNYIEFEIPNPLPKNMVRLIYKNWKAETSRTLLENELADLNAELGRISSQLIHYYSINRVNHKNNVKSIYESRIGINAKYQLVELAIESADFKTVNELLSLIIEEYELDTEDQAEHNNLQLYVNFRASLKAANKDYMQLDESKLAELRIIAQNKTGRASILAQNILCFGYNECQNRNSGTGKKQIERRVYDNSIASDKLSDLHIGLSPNPTNDFVNINVKGLEEDQTLDLKVMNSEGRLLIEKSVTIPKLKLNVKSWTRGIYLFQVSDAKQIIFTEKLIIL